MTLAFRRTSELGGEVKAMCYAPAGYGKTVLCSTAPAPLIISAENGLLSIKDKDIPFLEIETLQDFKDAYNFAALSEHAAGFQTICIDSISDIAERVLSDLKKNYKDPRQAYGELNDGIMEEMRKWRHLPAKNVYITCKQEKNSAEEGGVVTYAPSMPGKALPKEMPYWGDELFALRIIAGEDGVKKRWLQTSADLSYYAKDRSGKLDPYEEPNLTNIFAKIKGE